ncbi:MAG: glycosyltransferase family 2 protein [Planctomycetes bacterium]|nr:glycosyltransferase family 2 protein [Planctomycetota bacterium]
MTSSRDVAVVIPVRDGAAYLDEALASVFAQTLPPSEVVVVDDGSTDGSADVARAHDARVRVIPQPPLGAGAARNRGVESTTAPWLAFLDADDLWVPHKLATQHEALARQPEAVASIGEIRQFFSPDLGREGVPEPEIVSGTSPITLLVQRTAFEAAGPYPTDLVASEAPAWWVRFEATRPVVVRLPVVLAERRIHARNTGVLRGTSARAEYLKLAKAMLDRRRAEGGNA